MLNNRGMTMNQNLIVYYINQLTLEDVKKLAKQYNVKLDDNESKVILNFLKKNKLRINKENKNALLREAKPLLKKSTYDTLVLTIDKFL